MSLKVHYVWGVDASMGSAFKVDPFQWKSIGIVDLIVRYPSCFWVHSVQDIFSTRCLRVSVRHTAFFPTLG